MAANRRTDPAEWQHAAMYKDKLADEATPIPEKLSICYKLLMLFHSKPYPWLGRLSTLLASDPRVISFLSAYSSSAEPMALLTLRLLAYVVGSSTTARQSILRNEAVLGGVLGLLRAARGDPVLTAEAVALLQNFAVGEDCSKSVSRALGQEYSLLNLLSDIIKDSATYRHLRLEALNLLLCLALTPEGQAALWKKSARVKEALRAAMEDTQHPLAPLEGKRATKLARDLAALHLCRPD
eukprot:NODE_1494_length_958_cov_285.797580_g1035_i0.p1 GENE.NODE_1494_length_958_cov_285.797580_g1035_i0~~NODE_1494_length_958_cov_285.797580_g1035_i0.p1  ORF type:complete len:239 (-),score=62.03 NODE_1494_length_958_cov_285.797580_g1035_i0:119-835(-)